MREDQIDIQEVRNNPDKRWDLFWLSCNPALTVKDVETLELPNSKSIWTWQLLSNYMIIQEIRNNPNKPWDKYGLSSNIQLTVKDIESLQLPNSEDEWDWYHISRNIDIKEVINNPDEPWDKDGLLQNKGCTDKILEFFDAGLLKHLQRKIGEFKYHTDIAINCE